MRILVLMPLLVLSGCSLLSVESEESVNTAPSHICLDASTSVTSCDGKLETLVEKKVNEFGRQPNTPKYAMAMPVHTLEHSTNTAALSEYIEQVAAKLMSSVSEPLNQSAVGVTSLVELTPNRGTSNSVGNIIAEQFIAELHNSGVPVVDYKVTSDISRTLSGDYVFSRVNDQVSSAQFMNFVLTGTLLYSKVGLVVNVRLVNLHSKRVVSAAKKTVPYFILDNLIPAQQKQTIVL